ncbi:MAG: uroporphyrinogen decarboxylase family protein, partial [Eubacteriales bacterium]|nr:uroporphyrinogen decarboxylase family protein [Eubacteriales bacterium]
MVGGSNLCIRGADRSLCLPDPRAEGRFDGLQQALDEAESKGLYVQMNSPHCIFERMHFLRGFDDTLVDCMLEPELVEGLAIRMADYQIGIIEEAYRLGQGRIHCYDTTDDWGTQNNLMVSPAVFRSIFKPQYKRIFDAAHRCGMDVRFHTDGKVNDILPDIIEVGADIQATLPTGDKQKIEDEVKQLVEKWVTPQGG